VVDQVNAGRWKLLSRNQEPLHGRSAFAFLMFPVVPKLPHPAMVISGFAAVFHGIHW
jgi:hypothetical protein